MFAGLSILSHMPQAQNPDRRFRDLIAQFIVANEETAYLSRLELGE
jgi:hypothetical protein